MIPMIGFEACVARDDLNREPQRHASPFLEAHSETRPTCTYHMQRFAEEPSMIVLMARWSSREARGLFILS